MTKVPRQLIKNSLNLGSYPFKSVFECCKCFLFYEMNFSNKLKIENHIHSQITISQYFCRLVDVTYLTRDICHMNSTPLLFSLFGDAINPVGWIGLMIGLVGIICLGAPPELLSHWWLMGQPASISSLWSNGEAWMLAAAIAMAFGTVLIRFTCKESDPVAVTGWHMTLGGLPLITWHFFGSSWPAVPNWTFFDMSD